MYPDKIFITAEEAKKDTGETMNWLELPMRFWSIFLTGLPLNVMMES